MIATATLPVDRWTHGGEDPDPAEIHMPKWAPNLDLPVEGLITMAPRTPRPALKEGPAVRQMHPITRDGDELIATISPQCDVVLDESGCIVLNTNGSTRLTISDAGAVGRALLEARLVVEAREQGYDRRHPCGHPLCIMCNQPAGVPHVTGRLGDKTGPMCGDCAHYCDGNVTETISLGPDAVEKFRLAKQIADASVLVDDEHDAQWCDRSWHDGDCCDGSRQQWAGAHTTNPVRRSMASCGHPRNADGECDCSTWPEPNPHAHDGHVSCTPEGCVVR